jgi:hypothetical protein
MAMSIFIRLATNSNNAPYDTPISIQKPLQIVGGQEINNWLDVANSYKGEELVVIITVVWDVSCPYCLQELLYLQDEYGNRPDIFVIGLNPYDSELKIKSYMDKHRIPSIIMITGDINKPLGVPFTRIYLRDGTLIGEPIFGWNQEYAPSYLMKVITEAKEDK